MQPIADVVSAARLGINKARVAGGQAPLARDHLPFNRKGAPFDRQAIDTIAGAAASAGLAKPQLFELRDYLFRLGKRPELRGEAFMLIFNEARQRAREIIFGALPRGRARVVFDVYEAICVKVPRNAVEVEVSRDELAEAAYLSEQQVSRYTALLVRLDLLRKYPEGRGVRYVLLPVEDLGYPLWFGDRAARADAVADGMQRLARERQPELAV